MEEWTHDARPRPSPACSSGRSSRWTATSTCCALYVDPEEARLDADRYAIGGSQAAKDLNNAAIRQSTSTGAAIHPDQIESRTTLRVKSGERLSFGTYFNAFPASYWRRWTVVNDVTLTVEVEGHGATVIVYKSMAKGHSQRVGSPSRPTDGQRTRFSFELPLKPFIDGGWYWYDVVAGDDDVVVSSGEWTAEVPADRAEHGTVDIVITTMNRPDYVLQAAHPDRRDRGAAALPRLGDGHRAGHPADARLASSTPRRRSRSATSSA